MTRRTFALSVGAIASATMLCRLGYVSWQASHDPTFARPALDGALYVDWARGLLSGAGEPAGAFYLAPLFPHLLAGFLAIFGPSWTLLYALQQAMLVAAVCLLALGCVGRIGEVPALLAASTALLYHPAVFFASRPIGEPVALCLASAGLYVYSRMSAPMALVGLSLGLATLARPNLLLIAVGLIATEIVCRRFRRALVLAGSAALVLLPVTVRNLAASGHPVLVSSNGGLTLYHGNGPGALGIFTPAQGFSGTLAHQREEATFLARVRSGEELDPVRADRWWGRQAVRTRLQDPGGTVGLLARRALLTLDNYEHGLDDAPELDENPWRRAFPVPFSVMLGLATVGVVAWGFAASGGAAAWIPIGAAAATPLAFYVSSRYRLPMVVFLCIPAGTGAAAILGAARLEIRPRRIVSAIAAGVVVLLASILAPSGSLARSEEAAAHANRASAYAEAKDPVRAESEARKALALDASSVTARYNLAVIMAAAGRNADAERLYREALALDPSHAESAGNLAKLLVERGSAQEAVPILERALASRPGDVNCWTNLVVAFLSMNDPGRARRALAEGRRIGVQFEPQLVDAVVAGGRR